MLSYEICKKLKDAGLRFSKIGSYYLDEDSSREKAMLILCHHSIYPDSQLDRWTYIPTLSGLIEACDDGFMGIRRNKDKTFFAVRSDGHIMDTFDVPEEAVANLYLALHVK